MDLLQYLCQVGCHLDEGDVPKMAGIIPTKVFDVDVKSHMGVQINTQVGEVEKGDASAKESDSDRKAELMCQLGWLPFSNCVAGRN